MPPIRCLVTSSTSARLIHSSTGTSTSQRWELDLLEYEDAAIREIQEAFEPNPELAWVQGCTGQTPFLRLQAVVMPWMFAPDIMHLKDENVMKGYLKLWMGIQPSRRRSARRAELPYVHHNHHHRQTRRPV